MGDLLLDLVPEMIGLLVVLLFFVRGLTAVFGS